MRNLAVVALTDAGRSVTEVAAVFGVTATYVSMLRGRALDPRKHRRRRATPHPFSRMRGRPGRDTRTDIAIDPGGPAARCRSTWPTPGRWASSYTGRTVRRSAPTVTHRR